MYIVHKPQLILLHVAWVCKCCGQKNSTNGTRTRWIAPLLALWQTMSLQPKV